MSSNQHPAPAVAAETTRSTPPAPRRIQRRRTAGWRMPPGALYVGRPGRFGNPFPVQAGDRATATAKYRAWIATRPDLLQTAREQLAGRDLACWCPLPAAGEPDHCHAAVLLRIANTPSSTDTDAHPTGKENHS